MKTEKKFPTRLFVSASILCLVVLGSIYFTHPLLLPTKKHIQDDKRYFTKEDWQGSKDPFITVVPRKEDMLTGPVISVNDPSLGDEEADIFIVEYSDFLCGYCKNQEKILKSFISENPTKVRLIWKDYPESNTSSLSFKASQAGRCAFEQGKFWEYHDLLYNDDSLEETDLMQYARDLGLKTNVFEECLKDSEITRSIIENIQEAQTLGISGIPFIYVNDIELMGEVSREELEAIIKGENK